MHHLLEDVGVVEEEAEVEVVVSGLKGQLKLLLLNAR